MENEVGEILKESKEDTLKQRTEQAHDEIKAVLAKYKLDIGAKLNFSETSIVPTPMFIDKEEN